MSQNGKTKTFPSVKQGKATPGVLGSLFGESTRKTGLDADWSQVDALVIQRLVWAISFFGGSVTLGATRKGNAYSIKAYIGQAYDPMYFDGDEEGREAMREWVDQLVNAAAETA